MKQKIVIKLGGSSLESPETLKELATLVRGYHSKNYNVVVVHGGGPAINKELMSRRIEWKFINGQRQTTQEMIEVIELVLAKKVNSMIVNDFRKSDIPAVGLSGAKDKILFCVQSDPELMQVGKVKRVNIESIEAAFTGAVNATPVVAPIGFGVNDEKYNINADWAAAQIAIAVKARKLIYLTDQKGILDENKKLVPKANSEIINKMIESGVIAGGMYTKVMAMIAALNEGVKKVQVLQATEASQLLNSNKKIGTLLINDEVVSTKKDEKNVRAN